MIRFVLTFIVIAGLAGDARAAIAERFALIVTNNSSQVLGRPDLHYADDDGAKYAELFRSLMPADNVALLSEFDADSRGLYPQLDAIAVPPTRKALDTRVSGFARRAKQALAMGKRVEFYFVYAGHGDVENGGGFIELRDGRFTSADLKALLRSMPATASHVIVDSCNSFFLLHSRKPGGRRFATPEDAATALGKDLEHVGFFLSTNAEAEVYEWSELQSGVFSHAVRSGLLGAADANGDNSVGYRELQAFVHSAVADIKNPSYRPRVFSRPPGGKERAILNLKVGRVAQFEIDDPGALRVTVRDREGIPWIDVHKEAGSKLTLRLPSRLLAGFWLEELGRDGEVRLTRHHAPARDEPTPSRLAMTTLPATDKGHTRRRGPTDQLRKLFSRPFGPRAMALFQGQPQPAPIYGLARRDIERMDLVLSHAADAGRRYRLREGGLLVAVASGFGFASWHAFRTDKHVGGWLHASNATIIAISSLRNFLGESKAEKARSFFVRKMRSSDSDPVAVAAETVRRLEAIRERGRFLRRAASISAYSAAGLLAGIGGYAVYDGKTEVGLVTGGVGLVFVGLGLWAHFDETPVERAIKMWRSDSAVRSVPQLSLIPTSGGAAFGLSGQF